MKLPKRKHPRMKEHDYSSCGYYAITIHTNHDTPLLSVVGRGLAPAADGMSFAQVFLRPIGKVAEHQLLDLENRYDHVIVDKYVIMPTHIHAIIILTSETAGASPRPTIPDIICAYKSLTTRICNQVDHTPGRKIFQTSFFEHVIRNEIDYMQALQYIDQNPMAWLEKGKGL